MSEGIVAELQDVYVAYGRVLAVEGVSLGIPRGLTLVVGHNGSGKSTLVKVILGILRPLRGRVRTLGYDPARRPKGLYERVTYVSDKNPIHYNIRVETWLELLSGIYGEPVWGAAEMLGLTRHRGKRYSELSTGLRRRLALVEALASNRELVVVDEPFQGLDREGREIFSGGLEERRRERSFIVVSHINLPGVEPDFLVIMDSGRVSYSGRYDRGLAREWMQC